MFKREKGLNIIEVKDDGKGIKNINVDEVSQEQEGLGMFLVKVLTRQLNGELHIENKNGARIVITFPAE